MANSPAHPDELLRETLAAVAPGTELRDGLERILRGRTGALIVLGLDKVVEGMCSGGFELDVGFSATRLRELSKMDGAVVLDHEANRILRAAVQLLPDPTIETTESGTRHRTAERVAKQSGFPVISVSQSMRIVALYVGGQRHVLEDSDTILSRANQALATLERYRARLDEVSGTLSALEIEDLVTVRDVCSVVQRLEMVARISEEIAGYVIELGTDGRLLALQLDELIGGIGSDREFVIRDYVDLARKDRSLADVQKALGGLDSTQLLSSSSTRTSSGRPTRWRAWCAWAAPGPSGCGSGGSVVTSASHVGAVEVLPGARRRRPPLPLVARTVHARPVRVLRR
ncbi:DNA integrity scanning diadenylate cyclase DisA [Cellulosimicrobium cellulans]|uniref:DNA integrity scanning diadenylate cyclase DisA n=1 Tax=Cellulosimicrobium cellulans TaxID=1710 RepID=UPI000AFFA5B9|nr:DNA integrity scanning diadenylate cyclase DisA [Cellulosimicrobium cellulans]